MKTRPCGLFDRNKKNNRDETENCWMRQNAEYDLGSQIADPTCSVKGSQPDDPTCSVTDMRSHIDDPTMLFRDIGITYWWSALNVIRGCRPRSARANEAFNPSQPFNMKTVSNVVLLSRMLVRYDASKKSHPCELTRRDTLQELQLRAAELTPTV